MLWLLLYDVVEDYLESRGAYRDAHLALARAAHEQGELVLAGALADPVDGAMLVFKGEELFRCRGVRAQRPLRPPSTRHALARPALDRWSSATPDDMLVGLSA